MAPPALIGDYGRRTNPLNHPLNLTVWDRRWPDTQRPRLIRDFLPRPSTLPPEARAWLMRRFTTVV